MTDIESQIFTAIKTAVVAVSATANVVGRYVNESKKFPTVSVEEINNVVWRNSLPLNLTEKNAVLTYEINIYTVGSTAKGDGKALRNVIDTAMSGLGFVRNFCQPIPNLSDGQIFRYVIRYNKIM